MPPRFVFRLTYFQNLRTDLGDGRLYAKDHPQVQNCYRISYEDIVARRGSGHFVTPCGSNINNFVPFYFSPITAMAYAIHIGNVRLRNELGEDCGTASLDDVAHIVLEPAALIQSANDCWFSNIACNSG